MCIFELFLPAWEEADLVMRPNAAMLGWDGVEPCAPSMILRFLSTEAIARQARYNYVCCGRAWSNGRCNGDGGEMSVGSGGDGLEKAGFSRDLGGTVAR